MSDTTKLAVAQALYNALKDQTTRGRGGLRDAVDAELLEQYAADGTDRKRIFINGIDAGYITVTGAKVKKRLSVTDYPALVEWISQHPDDVADWFSLNPAQAEAFAGDQLICTGEVLPGCELVEDETPPKTTLRVYPEKVVEGLGAQLPEYVAGVLTDGS